MPTSQMKPWERFSGASNPESVSPDVTQEPQMKPWERFSGEKKPSSTGEAFLGGVSDAATLGYEPSLQAMGTKGLLMADDLIHGTHNSELLPYKDLRNEASQHLADLQEESPVAYGSGALAGTLGSIPVAAGALAKIPGLAAPAGNIAGRIAQGVGSGAVMAGAQNPGDDPNASGFDSPSDFFQPAKRLNNMEVGAGFGAGGALLAEGGRAAASLAGKIGQGKAAETLGIKGGEIKRSFSSDKLGNEGQSIKDLVNYAMNKGIVKAGDTIEKVTKKSGEALDTVGKEIGSVYKKVMGIVSNPENFSNLSPEQLNLLDSTAFRPKQMAQEFLTQVQNMIHPEGEETISKASRLAKNFMRIPDPETGIDKIQDFKKSLDKLIYNASEAYKKGGQPPPGDQAIESFRDFLKGKMDQRISALDSIVGGDIGQHLSSLNQDYHKLGQVHTIAKGKLASEMAKSTFSLGDKFAAAAGMSAGATEGYREGGVPGAVKGALIGSALGVGSKAVRTVAPAIGNLGRRVVQGTGGLLGKNPGLIGSQTTQLFNRPGKK